MFFILGPKTPEMDSFEDSLQILGIDYAYATVDGRRMLASDSWECQLSWKLETITAGINCSIPQVPLIRLDDTGFKLSEYMMAQLLKRLS